MHDRKCIKLLAVYRHDFKLVFGVDIQTTMDKADRLMYGESMMTHAMVFTGVSVDVSIEAFKACCKT